MPETFPCFDVITYDIDKADYLWVSYPQSIWKQIVKYGLFWWANNDHCPSWWFSANPLYSNTITDLYQNTDPSYKAQRRKHDGYYRKISNISRTKFHCSCLCSIHWSQVLSWEWRCSWSSADRRCSDYIWVIDNFIAYKGASYIRDLTVQFIFRLLQKIWAYLQTYLYPCILADREFQRINQTDILE